MKLILAVFFNACVFVFPLYIHLKKLQFFWFVLAKRDVSLHQWRSCHTEPARSRKKLFPGPASAYESESRGSGAHFGWWGNTWIVGFARSRRATLISNPLSEKLRIRTAQEHSVKQLLYHKGKFNLKMFLHHEQSKRQPLQWAFIFLKPYYQEMLH